MSSFKTLLCFVALQLCGPAISAAGELPPVLRPFCERVEIKPYSPPLKLGSRTDAVRYAIVAGEPTSRLRMLLQQNRRALDQKQGALGYTWLEMAAVVGNWPAAQELLKAGAKVDAPGWSGQTPFQGALAAGQFGIACQLLKAGARLPDAAQNPTLLPLVALNDDFRGAAVFADYLIRHGGYRVNATAFGTRDTALMIAAELGNQQLVEVLLARGADVSQKNSSGQTARDLAIAAGNQSIAQLLGKR